MRIAACFIFLTTVLFLMQDCHAQNTNQGVLTLTQALNNTLKNNFQLEVEKNNVAKAINKANRGYAGQMPVISTQASADYQRSQARTVLAGRLGGGAPDTTQAGAGQNETVISNPAATTISGSAQLGIDYTVFNGFNAKYNYERLIELTQNTQLSTRAAIENTLMQVIAIYIQAALNQRNYAIIAQNIKISDQQLERLRVAGQFGQAKSLQILNLETTQKRDSADLARLALEFENNVLRLNRLMNQPLDQTFKVEDNFDLLAISKDELWQLAQANNVAILLAENNRVLAGIGYKLSESRRYPTLGVGASTFYNGNRSDAGFINGQRNIGVRAGANLSYTIYNGGKVSTDIQNSIIDIEISDINLENTQQQVATDFAVAWATYENYRYIALLEQQSINIANQNLKRTQAAFDLGQQNTQALREAQLNMVRTENSLNQALLMAKQSEFELLRLAGLLVE